ncbi:hypothetical protein ZTR_10621 [Talaromyces verruculosus]|nr:hypothetical protein ZTR_10621 [Talaromyces verruculosus]
MATPSKKEFQIGWVCALPIEAAAAVQMLDENYGILQEQERANTNTYPLGRIGHHHVVIASLPDGIYGTTSATTVANNMMRTFSESLRIGLMVGIGGEAPTADHDIRLASTDYYSGISNEYWEFSSPVKLAKITTFPRSLCAQAVQILRASKHLRDDFSVAFQVVLEEFLNRIVNLRNLIDIEYTLF